MEDDFGAKFPDGTSSSDPEILLAGRYRVVRELGRGAMGTVYLVEDTKLGGKLFSAKMPLAVLAGNPRVIESLKAEALVAMRLAHPHVVTLRAFEESSDGVFLVMDYVEGRTLEDLLAERGKLREEEVVRIFTLLAEALDYAHSEGVVHRDIKPSNILLSGAGRPYLSDFGIAREMRDSLTRHTGLSSTGTLPYMSPEQLGGAAPTAAQDVYSLAATMYECLEGNPPFFRGDIAHQIESRPAEFPGRRPTELERSILRGLAKEPGRRPSTCGALVSAEPAPASARGPGPRRGWLVAALIGLLLAVGVSSFFFARGRGFEGRLALDRPASPLSGRRTIEVTGRLTHAEGGCVRIDGETVSIDADGRFSHPVPLLDGRNAIKVVPCDASGNEGPTEILVIELDARPPRIVTLEPQSGTVVGTGSVRISGRLDEPNLRQLLIAGTPVEVDAAGGFFREVNLPVEGKNELRITAHDRAGNTHHTDLRVFRDLKPPVIRILEPADGLRVNEARVSVRGLVEDANLAGAIVDGNEVEVSRRGGFEGTADLHAGENRIEITATDVVGHATRETIRVVLDQRPPSLSLDPFPGTTADESILLSGSLEEVDCRVDVGGEDAGIDGLKFRARVDLKPGRNPILVVARDAAGNTAELRIVVERTRKAAPVPKAPVIRIESPRDRQTVGPDPVRLRGRCVGEVPPGATVAAAGRSVPVGEDGRFDFEVRIERDSGRRLIVNLEHRGETIASSSVGLSPDFDAPSIRMDPVPTFRRATLAVSGTVGEDGCTVTMNGIRGTVTGREFRVEFTPTSPGTLRLVAEDRVGNRSVEEFPLKPPPGIGVIDEVRRDHLVITPNASVTVEAGDRLLVYLKDGGIGVLKVLAVNRGLRIVVAGFDGIDAIRFEKGDEVHRE